MTNQYAYENDRLTDIIVNQGTRYQFVYDSFGRTTETKVGNGTTYNTLSTLEYNTFGLLTKQIYGNNDFISFSYDNLDRLTEKSYNNSSTDKVQYFYGADGNISHTIDFSTSTKTKYVYDLAGRIVSIRDYKYGDYTNSILKSSVEYTYADKTNYLTGISHFSPLGTQNIGYRYGNSANGEMPDQIYGVTWNNKNVLNYTYDGLGRLTNKSVILSESEESQLNTTYEYFDVENSDKTTTLLSSLETANGTYSYTYDALGNITSISHGTYTTSYVYDVRNQLVRENDQRAGKTYVYTYQNGNITSRKEYAYTTGTLGDVVSTEIWGYDTNSWKDLLGYWNGKYLTYDMIGNPLTLGNMSMTWQGRQLQSISMGKNTYTFDYNMDGQRISKTYTTSSGAVTKTEYCYNGNILAGQKTGNDTIIFMYDNNGDIFGFTYNGTPYYYVKNAQNDVTAITNANGNIVVRYFYNAWGEIIDCQDTSTNGIGDINPITYRSYYKDEIFDTYLYYLNSRYYYPEMCRFLNADGVYDTNTGILSHNMFAYCNNNPTNCLDPDGTCRKFLGFLWKIDCKQASCKTSKNYVAPKSVDPTGTYNKGKGYVYIVPEEDATSIMENKEDNVVVIVDKRVGSSSNYDPNMQIIDSHKIGSKTQQREISQMMLDYNEANPVTPAWSRTIDSLVTEWQIHNTVYNLGLFRENTADCDFNSGDEGKGYWDFFVERVLK